MTYKIIGQALMNPGIKIVCKTLREASVCSYIYFDEENRYWVDETGYTYYIDHSDYNEEWEIYQEKPKKVKKAYYRGYFTIANEQDVVYETQFVSNKNRLLEMLSTYQIIKIEETDFEVEKYE